MLDARKAHDQIIDNANLDTVNVAAWNGDYEKKAEADIATFRQFIKDNKNEITALTILYDGTWKSRPLTLQMIQEVHDALQKRNLSTERLWSAYHHTQMYKVKTKSPVSKLIDIVALLRFELGITSDLTPYSDTVNYNFMRWTMAKNAGPVHFTEEQMGWLRMARILSQVQWQLPLAIWTLPRSTATAAWENFTACSATVMKSCWMK